MSKRPAPFHRAWPMVRPRIAIETQNSWDDITAADQEKLLGMWREFMAADCGNDLAATHYRSGANDVIRFSEKHCHARVTFAWRCLLIGYWLGLDAQERAA